MVSFDRDALLRAVVDLDRGQRIGFVASCVERRAPCFRELTGPDRSGDVTTFDGALGALWADAAGVGSAEPAESYLERIEEFEELVADEEAAGKAAYAEDAVVAELYALQVASGQDEYALHCASRLYDSAGFLDDSIADGARFADTELHLQRNDLEMLRDNREPLQVRLEQLRRRSADEGSRFLLAVRRLDSD